MKAWATAINERKPDALLPLLADDFHWVTSFRHAPIGARLEDMESFILTAPLEAFEYESTIHNLSLIHISEPTRLGMISYAVF